MEPQQSPIGNLHDYYADRARWIAERDGRDAALPDAQAWRKLRPTIHRWFMASLGLDPLPEACDLRAAEMGAFAGPGYTAKKLAYQLLPDCWGSAHLYRPEGVPDDRATPAVLYACGHQPSGVIGYRHHAVAWARRGYTCLIFDTIEQHDNPGDHHGLNRGATPQWIAMGYTPCGAEVYNGMRALALLLEQPGVDPQRVGVTGISGGGAQSFLLAAADGRLRAVATVAGVSSPALAIRNGLVQSHCGCMYMHNRYGHDVSLYSALVAPRAVLYCYARHDPLYSPAEYRDFYKRSRARFERLGYGECCVLYEYDGPHGYNHRGTTDTIHHWFDQHVAGEAHPDVDTLAIAAEQDAPDEATLSVFHGQTPQPNRLHLLPDLIAPRPQIRLPDRVEQWNETRQSVIERIRSEAFQLIDDVQYPQTLDHLGRYVGDTNLDRYRGRLDLMDQELALLSSRDDGQGPLVVVIGERRQVATAVAAATRDHLTSADVSILAIQPRAAGFAAFREDQRAHLNREGCLVGLPPTTMMVQDLHHLWPAIKALPGIQNRKLYLYGVGEGAVAMLYHAVLRQDPDVAGVILEALPASFDSTPFQILNARQAADIPHAVGLLAPTAVALVRAEGLSFDWSWAHRAHARCRGHLFETSTPAKAFSHLLP